MRLGDMPAYPPTNEWIEAVREELSGLTIRERVALGVLQAAVTNGQFELKTWAELSRISFSAAEAWLAEAQKRREQDEK